MATVTVTAPFSLSFHPFHDLSDALQRHLLHEMTNSFEKPWADLTHLRRRFLRPSCRVGLFRHDGVLKAAAFLWREPDVLYLDKFFVLRSYQNQRIGTPFLHHLLDHVLVSHPLLWRTDAILATRFYGKHPAVRTIGTHGDYFYQVAYNTARCSSVKYSVLSSLLRMESAFQPTAPKPSPPSIS